MKLIGIEKIKGIEENQEQNVERHESKLENQVLMDKKLSDIESKLKPKIFQEAKANDEMQNEKNEVKECSESDILKNKPQERKIKTFEDRLHEKENSLKPNKINSRGIFDKGVPEICKSLSERIDSILEDYSNKMNKKGELNENDRDKMINELKQEYDKTPKEQRINTFVPEKAEYLADPPIGRYKDDIGNEHQYCNYDFPNNGGFKGKPHEIIPNVGDRFNRVGGDGGYYVSPEKNGRISSVESRSIPYHFTEDDITHEPSFHRYEVIKKFDKLQDEINNYKSDSLSIEEIQVKKDGFLDEFEDFSGKGNDADTYKHESGKTYEGEIAPAFEENYGGDIQWELPMSIKSLKELGMIKEVYKEDV